VAKRREKRDEQPGSSFIMQALATTRLPAKPSDSTGNAWEYSYQVSTLVFFPEFVSGVSICIGKQWCAMLALVLARAVLQLHEDRLLRGGSQHGEAGQAKKAVDVLPRVDDPRVLVHRFHACHHLSVALPTLR